jgi:hemoglobin
MGAGDDRGRTTESEPVPSSDLAQDDLMALLTDFYARAEADELLAPYFAELDMPAHMPRIVAFWETMLFDAGTYSGNAFLPHARMPGLTPEHFVHWLRVLEATLDARFAGPNVQRMKDLAHRIAYSMQVRLHLEPAEPFRPWRIGERT